ncbi:RHS repeat-associated protein [Rhodanobacter sp. K2T2]|uniref:RHS repeat-associated core domain-containing protein n=1 Tax=Rhodanobacter sp. K2T2 TaxID=2723085 RepID=UPI0015CDA486|nr:RHS repeat-associated core domain-containing protein [Rhodanobacter sp. K2T2]NYE29638.1 RHS repeat-associated protein [Rhodanobacter sp. K2T2]
MNSNGYRTREQASWRFLQSDSSSMTYDALDRLTGVTDPSSLTTTYTYDGLGNGKTLQSPDTGTSTDTFDAAGNRLTHTDAKGVVSTSTYDALDRPSSTSYTDTTLNVAYHYDEANAVTGCSVSSPVGRLTRVVENAVTTTYCYDIRGNVIQKRQQLGTTLDTTSYSYTLADRLQTTVNPDSTATTYSRDADGRVTSIAVSPPMGAAVTAVNAIDYRPFGPVSSYTLGNGQVITRAYDANDALTDLTSPALNLHFARDAMGNINAEGAAAGANPATETYSYDPLYRLTAIADGTAAIEGLTYNPTGDRLSKTGSGLGVGSYTYASGTHRLSGIGTAARTSDANGNTTASASAGQTWGYGYNGRNRLTVVQANGSTVGTYTYNAMGQRIQKVATSPTVITQRYAYDEQSHLIGEYASANNRDTIWLGDVPVATVDTAGATSTIAYVTADQLGTPRAVSNSAGVTIWSWPYVGNPFGESAPISTAGYVLNLRYPGQYFDVETGLNYNVNRIYEPATGRYIQSDPIGLDGGINTYLYAGATPLTEFDPLGLRPPTPSEITFLRSIFGRCFDASKLDINKRLFGSRAWSPYDHKVNLPGSDFVGGSSDNSVNIGDPYIASILAHETLHTWQRDQGANVTTSEIGPQIAASLGGSDPYSYDQSMTDPAANLTQFQALFNGKSYEAQAQMWQDYVYSKLTGGDVGKWSQVSNYVQSHSSCGCQ